MFLDDKLTREVYDDRYCELGKFDIFESIMEKVIVGEMAEYGKTYNTNHYNLRAIIAVGSLITNMSIILVRSYFLIVLIN